MNSRKRKVSCWVFCVVSIFLFNDCKRFHSQIRNWLSWSASRRSCFWCTIQYIDYNWQWTTEWWTTLWLKTPLYFKYYLFRSFFCQRGRFPSLPWDFLHFSQWSCSASGSLWEMPDSNPVPLPQKSGEPPHLHIIIITVQCTISN